APDEVTVLDERFGIRTAPILLLARPDVQRDLQLDPAQVSGAKRTIARLIEMALNVKTKSGPAVLAERPAIDGGMANRLRQTLKAGQLERLRQIDLQWEGGPAISRPVVAEYLKLTDAQRLAVGRLLAAQREAWRAHGRLTPSDREHLSRQALAVLSPAQGELWARLLGPPCPFSIGGPSGGSSRNPADVGGFSRP